MAPAPAGPPPRDAMELKGLLAQSDEEEGSPAELDLDPQHGSHASGAWRPVAPCGLLLLPTLLLVAVLAWMGQGGLREPHLSDGTFLPADVISSKVELPPSGGPLLPRKVKRTFGPRRNFARLLRKKQARQARQQAVGSGPLSGIVGLSEESAPGGDVSCELPESNEKEWSELAENETHAAEDLGWSKEMWNCKTDDCDSPDSSERGWGELKTSQQEAAKTLGYNKHTWELPLSEGMAWDMLDDDQQASAKALGWSKDSWDCDKEACNLPASENRSWKDLSVAEEKGARGLGWSHELWDGCA